MLQELVNVGLHMSFCILLHENILKHLYQIVGGLSSWNNLCVELEEWLADNNIFPGNKVSDNHVTTIILSEMRRSRAGDWEWGGGVLCATRYSALQSTSVLKKIYILHISKVYSSDSEIHSLTISFSLNIIINVSSGMVLISLFIFTRCCFPLALSTSWRPPCACGECWTPRGGSP